MNEYNITAQVYGSGDIDKQTLLINQVINGRSPEEASDNFKGQNATEFKVIKIYSVEKI